MKTDPILISADPRVIAAALDEVERTAVFCRLDTVAVNTLRLLTEESVAMTVGVLADISGQLWLETNGRQFEIHLTADAPVTFKAREAFIEVSTAKRSTMPRGLKAKISYLFAGLLTTNPALEDDPLLYTTMAYGFMGETYAPTMSMMGPPVTWSMAVYNLKAPPSDTGGEGHNLEKSIIERFADDVVVSVTPTGVEMIVKKTF